MNDPTSDLISIPKALSDVASEAGYELRPSVDARGVSILAAPTRAGLSVRSVFAEIGPSTPRAAAIDRALDMVRTSLSEALAEATGTFVAPTRIGVPS